MKKKKNKIICFCEVRFQYPKPRPTGRQIPSQPFWMAQWLEILVRGCDNNFSRRHQNPIFDQRLPGGRIGRPAGGRPRYLHHFGWGNMIEKRIIKQDATFNVREKNCFCFKGLIRLELIVHWKFQYLKTIRECNSVFKRPIQTYSGNLSRWIFLVYPCHFF